MDTASCLSAIRENMKKAVVGKDDIIDLMLVSLICSGHVLIEDLPGLGKTTLVSALASVIRADGLTPILYTDGSYAPSNACYRKIGFRVVGQLCTVTK